MEYEKHQKSFSCDWQSQGQGFDSTNLNFLIVQLFVGTALVSAVKRIVDLSIGDITADKATGVSAEEIPGDKGDK